MKAKVNGIEYDQDENGNWIMKGGKSKIPKLKGDGRYKDAPRYPVIYDYEGEFKENWKNTVDAIKNELIDKFKNL